MRSHTRTHAHTPENTPENTRAPGPACVALRVASLYTVQPVKCVSNKRIISLVLQIGMQSGPTTGNHDQKHTPAYDTRQRVDIANQPLLAWQLMHFLTLMEFITSFVCGSFWRGERILPAAHHVLSHARVETRRCSCFPVSQPPS